MSDETPTDRSAQQAAAEAGAGGEERPPRRTALATLLWGAATIVIAPVAFVAGRFLKPPRGSVAMVVAGAPGDVGPDTVRVLKVGATDAALMRDDNGKLYALNLRCTHAGCNVGWHPDDAMFVCPCHGGKFDRAGAVLEGPPKLPLQRLELRVDAKTVIVTDIPDCGKVDNAVDKVRS